MGFVGIFVGISGILCGLGLYTDFVLAFIVPLNSKFASKSTGDRIAPNGQKNR